MAMVRRGVMFSLRDASCCKLEVVKGGVGLRCLSVRFTVFTANCSCFSSSTMRWVSASSFGSYFLPFTP